MKETSKLLRVLGFFSFHFLAALVSGASAFFLSEIFSNTNLRKKQEDISRVHFTDRQVCGARTCLIIQNSGYENLEISNFLHRDRLL